MTNSNQIKVS